MRRSSERRVIWTERSRAKETRARRSAGQMSGKWTGSGWPPLSSSWVVVRRDSTSAGSRLASLFQVGQVALEERHEGEHQAARGAGGQQSTSGRGESHQRAAVLSRLRTANTELIGFSSTACTLRASATRKPRPEKAKAAPAAAAAVTAPFAAGDAICAASASPRGPVESMTQALKDVSTIIRQQPRRHGVQWLASLPLEADKSRSS